MLQSLRSQRVGHDLVTEKLKISPGPPPYLADKVLQDVREAEVECLLYQEWRGKRDKNLKRNI